MTTSKDILKKFPSTYPVFAQKPIHKIQNAAKSLVRQYIADLDNGITPKLFASIVDDNPTYLKSNVNDGRVSMSTIISEATLHGKYLIKSILNSPEGRYLKARLINGRKQQEAANQIEPTQNEIDQRNSLGRLLQKISK